MKAAPRLLNYNHASVLPQALFTDLQCDKIFSAQAVSVLKRSCDQNEILRRETLFARLIEGEPLERLKTVLVALTNAERAYSLLQQANIPLDRYYRYRNVLISYVYACESLTSLSDLGSMFEDISAYYSSDEKQCTVSEIKEAYQRITALLERLHTGLLSFADKNWLTPNDRAVSEFDQIAECANNLGFSSIEKKSQNAKVNLALSDAICQLYADETSEIDTLLAKFAEIDFCEPFAYISEIKFFVEICELVHKAEARGILHCIPKIAQQPQYVTTELYDISLLAKNCDCIIPNDADFTENEPFYFLLGANGGGKTTYLRAIGINLVLFRAGCPVFAKDAEIYPFESICSHFPKDERFDNIGRLDEERARVEEMLNRSNQKTAFLLFNETFSGTDDKRGFLLLKETVEQVRQAKQFGLFVSHFHEVMSLDYPVLSAETDPTDKNKRTYRIVKAKGKISSYADDILKKYRLDRESLRARRNEYGN